MYDVRDPNCIFVFGFRTQVRGFLLALPPPAPAPGGPEMAMRRERHRVRRSIVPTVFSIPKVLASWVCRVHMGPVRPLMEPYPLVQKGKTNSASDRWQLGCTRPFDSGARCGGSCVTTSGVLCRQCLRGRF